MQNLVENSLQLVYKDMLHQCDDLSQFMQQDGKKILAKKPISETVSGDLFQTALLSNLLCPILNIYKIGPDLTYVLMSRLRKILGHYTGRGWRYFPTVKLMPEDSDTTIEVLRSLLHFNLMSPKDAKFSINIIAHYVRSDGSVPTWLVPKSAEDEVDKIWTGTYDSAVIANVGLMFLEYCRYQKIFLKLAERITIWLLNQYSSKNGWTSSWYTVKNYVDFRCIELLFTFCSNEFLEAFFKDILQRISNIIKMDKNTNSYGLDLAFCALIIEKLTMKRFFSKKTNLTNSLANDILNILLDLRTDNGRWQPYTLFSNPSPTNSECRREWASTTFSTAICARAVHALEHLNGEKRSLKDEQKFHI